MMTESPDSRAVPTAPAWRTIETAPFEDVEHAPGHTAKWLAPCLLGRFDTYGFIAWVGMMDAGMWLSRDDTRACGDCEEPTHWMPLPEGPAKAEGGA